MQASSQKPKIADSVGHVGQDKQESSIDQTHALGRVGDDNLSQTPAIVQNLPNLNSPDVLASGILARTFVVSTSKPGPEEYQDVRSDCLS